MSALTSLLTGSVTTLTKRAGNMLSLNNLDASLGVATILCQTTSLTAYEYGIATTVILGSPSNVKA